MTLVFLLVDSRHFCNCQHITDMYHQFILERNDKWWWRQMENVTDHVWKHTEKHQTPLVWPCDTYEWQQNAKASSRMSSERILHETGKTMTNAENSCKWSEWGGSQMGWCDCSNWGQAAMALASGAMHHTWRMNQDQDYGSHKTDEIRSFSYVCFHFTYSKCC